MAPPAAPIDAALPRATLVLGGARSGKSAFAESLVLAWPGKRLYLATAQALDEEMRARIAAHRRRRGDAWPTVEAPLLLPEALRDHGAGDTAILVDCLTLWLTNLMLAGRDPASESESLVTVLARCSSPVVLVANEVGLGIVPDNKLARDFRDQAGRLNQRLAALAERVVLVAAGLPLTLKETRP